MLSTSDHKARAPLVRVVAGDGVIVSHAPIRARKIAVIAQARQHIEGAVSVTPDRDIGLAVTVVIVLCNDIAAGDPERRR